MCTLSIPHSPDWNIAGHQGANICVLLGNSGLVLLPWCDEAGVIARIPDISNETSTSEQEACTWACMYAVCVPVARNVHTGVRSIVLVLRAAIEHVTACWNVLDLCLWLLS